MSDRIDQAAVLGKAVVREGLPETAIHHVGHLDISEDVVSIDGDFTRPRTFAKTFSGVRRTQAPLLQARDVIPHGEKYDPTLEKLPRRFESRTILDTASCRLRNPVQKSQYADFFVLFIFFAP
ncbi:hypothetical protein KIN20_020941 [Parelaphostrongylus tenuis]|uniref:Uncharacterized protein n=1 Tax=Parelaphostrongylus tenuis TaxID=148309 RepID=A0AAD5QVV2_PARTN|nr:hypothetical protein KIN20_020941 [Parelaphostrongylus tenuis]